MTLEEFLKMCQSPSVRAGELVIQLSLMSSDELRLLTSSFQSHRTEVHKKYRADVDNLALRKQVVLLRFAHKSLKAAAQLAAARAL